MKKKSIYLIIVSSALVIGITTGVIVKKVFGSEDVLYTGGVVDNLKIDAEANYKKVDARLGTKSKIDSFNAVEIINYSLEKYRRCENSFSYCSGLCDTIVKQVIGSCQIKNGDSYFEETVSKSSMVAVGNRMYQQGKDGNISLYSANGSSIQFNDISPIATYDEKGNELSQDEYSSLYGRSLDEMFIYSITNTTVLASEITKIENGYSVFLSLDPDLSTYFYKLQMKNLSNLNKLPVFSKVQLTYTLDEDLYPTKLSVVEDYVVTLVVDASIHATLESSFFANRLVKIPDINENVEYKEN